MTSQRQDDFTAPVQLESLLEVPVKLILIEDLIREKSASLGLRDSDSPTKDKEALSSKKCLFDCCATPSRWRNTNCYSNNSQFRTAGITLPWHESVAVIPVMQVEEESRIMSSSPNENTVTADIEMHNKNLDEDKEDQPLSPDSTPLSLVSKKSNSEKPSYANMPSLDEDEIPITVVETPENLSTTGNVEQGERVRVSPASTSPVVEQPSATALLGKVTEKPTRYEDLIAAESSSPPRSISASNTITSPNKQQQSPHEDANSRETDTGNREKNISADDTLKLTFYNEGRRESTKEYRTTGSDSVGTSAGSGGDVRFFENQHGLQMSRVIRESGADSGSETGTRARANQQSVIEESGESASPEDTQTQRKSPSSKENNPPTAQTTSVITQQSQQLRLTSSIIQTLNGNNNNATTSNSASNSSNNNNSQNTTSPTSTTTQPGRQWDGLQISRCQKEGTSVIMLDGESSNGSVSNREINSERSVSNTARNPPESEKGENENSIERHLQSYLTSLRYVKPAESGNERASSGSQDGETSSAKGRSPIISPQSRHQPQSNIVSPVISPNHSNTGSPGAAGAGVINRMSTIQRVSPSQQASSLDSWPERTIARIPTRPFLRRNSTYEVQQQQQQQQQQQSQPTTIAPRPPYHQNILQQQQSRIMSTSTSMAMSSSATSTEAVTAIPLHSPPKRFKPTNLAATGNPIMAHQQQQQQQQQYHPQYHQQGYNAQNRFPNASGNMSQQHASRNDHPTQMIQQQQQQHNIPVTTASNLTRVSTIQQQPIQAYANLQHYNQQRPTTQQHSGGSASTVSSVTPSPHHSPATAHMYAAQQQHQQQQSHHSYQMKYRQNASNLEAQHHQQQLQFHRHMQESLLMATSAVASSTEPVDSTYSERLRRYCDFYNRQELDMGKLQEYYKKYGFYPWDILTVRDESIMRQMRVQDQRQQQQQNQHQMLQQEVRQGQNANVARYDMVRRMEMEHVPAAQPIHHQQQQAHHQVPVRAMNVSPGRAASHYPQSQQQPVMAHAASMQGGMTNRGANAITPPLASPQQHSGTIQNRYSQNSHQNQLQRIQQMQQRDYHQQQQQQQINNRYNYQSGQTSNQGYRHPQHNQMVRAGQAQASASLPTNYDIQNSPHYRNAYNQLATAAAAVSSVAAAAAVSQNQLRSGNQVVNPVRDERMTHLVHSQSSSGTGNRPVVMTVSDPVPAPPEAVPLSIHRQALEQAIKNNQAAVKTAEIVHGNQGVTIYRRDQRRSPPSPLPNHQQQQAAHHGHMYALGRPRSGGESGISGTAKEPLRVVPSPTLAHQTSVIRRIQQQESSPTAASSFGGTATRTNQFMSERPGISYRRISNGSSTDSNGGGGSDPNLQTAFLYQQHKESITLHAGGGVQYQQQHHHLLNEASGPHGMSMRRNMMSSENAQLLARAGQKRRIIISDNNGANQNHPDTLGVVSSPIALIAGEEEMVNPAALMANIRDELPDMEDRGDSVGGGASWQYDHVVLLDKRIKTYMCKRCFETLKTEQQIRNHLFCKMLANHVQCHVCLQLITADTYPTHLQIHGVRPPDHIQIAD